MVGDPAMVERLITSLSHPAIPGLGPAPSLSRTPPRQPMLSRRQGLWNKLCFANNIWRHGHLKGMDVAVIGVSCSTSMPADTMGRDPQPAPECGPGRCSPLRPAPPQTRPVHPTCTRHPAKQFNRLVSLSPRRKSTPASTSPATRPVGKPPRPCATAASHADRSSGLRTDRTRLRRRALPRQRRP